MSTSVRKASSLLLGNFILSITFTATCLDVVRLIPAKLSPATLNLGLSLSPTSVYCSELSGAKDVFCEYLIDLTELLLRLNLHTQMTRVARRRN